MIQKSLFSLDNNVYIILLIIISVIIILFYLNKTNNKHNTLYEKYGDTPYDNNEYLKQNIPTDPLPYYYPIQSSTVSLRPCQIRFTSNNSSAYVFEDEWKEFDTIANKDEEGKDVVLNNPYKIFTKNGTSNMMFKNFSEESRCFKLKNENNMKNTYKYKANDLISYNNNKYTTFTTAENGKKEYMQMNFDPSLNDTQYHNSALDSICSFKYRTVLEPPLQTNILYRLSINDDEVENIEKSYISDDDNSKFLTDDLVMTELLNMESIVYYYENGSFKFRIIKDDTPLNIIVYKFERNLLCSDEEILSYDKLSSDDTKLNTSALINVENLIQPINIDDTGLPYNILNDFKTSKYYYNYKNERVDYDEPIYYNNKGILLSKLKKYIDDRINVLNFPIKNKIAEMNNELQQLENNKNAFAEKISTIDKYIINIITLDSQNYEEDTRNFLNTFYKPGKIYVIKHIDRKVLEPIITGGDISTNLNDIKDTKTINYAVGTNNNVIINMPHFPDAYYINNKSNTLSYGNWVVKSSLNTVNDEGLSALIQNHASRNITQRHSSMYSYHTERWVDRGYYTWGYRGYGWRWRWEKYWVSNRVFDGYDTHWAHVTKNSAYGAIGTKPEITITMPQVYYITGFKFYGIKEQHNVSHNAKNIEVYGKFQNDRKVWITEKIFKFTLPNNASWNTSELYKVDVPGYYKEIVFKVLDNWGNKDSTKIGNIYLFNNPNMIEQKDINFLTDISVNINNKNYRINAGNYTIRSNIKDKSSEFINKNNKTILKFNNTRLLKLTYTVPKKLNELLEYNKSKQPFNHKKWETKEKDEKNFIELTSNKNLDEYETYKISAYLYNNKKYIPNIILYDSNKKEISREKYKIIMDEYPDKWKMFWIKIYIIVDISISGAIYLKTTRNNNELFHYNSKNPSVDSNSAAYYKSVKESTNAKYSSDLKDIFEITKKEGEISELESLIINESNFIKDDDFKKMLSVKRDMEEYEEDAYINKIKNTYNNILNYVSTDDSAVAFLNDNINVNTGFKIEGQENYDIKKYISYQDVDDDMRTPSAERVIDNEVYDVKQHAKRYIYFTKK
jgi:hypothetical protein